MKLCIALLLLLSTFLHAQWQYSKIPNTPPVEALVCTKTSSSSMKIFAGTALGIYCTLDTGKTWINSSQGLSTRVRALTVSDSVLIAGTFSGGFYKSIDEGLQWTACNTVATQNLWISCFTSLGNTVFAGTSQGIFRSTTGGSDWMQMNTGLTNLTVRSLCLHGTKVIAGTNAGVFLSADLGAHWIPASSGMSNKSIAALLSTEEFDFASTSSGVYRSTDQGDNWNLATTGITNLPVVTFASVVGADQTRHLYAGTFKGVIFQSTDYGSNWIQVADLADTLEAMVSSETFLFAGAQSGTVWRAVASQTSNFIDSQRKIIPEDFQLTQNFPNPFNPSTTISYQLSAESRVLIAVYDLLGCEVAVLVSERKPAGRYEVTWDASHFSSGVYFYKLTAGSFVETRRMMLLK